MSARPALTGLIALAILFLPSLFLPSAGFADSPGPPWAIAVSPAAITLRWYADEIGEPQAHQVAAAHCGLFGRAAALAGLELDGSIEIGSYRCQ